MAEAMVPLRLVHFSDLHADRAALRAIRDSVSAMKPLPDDVICTGDLTAEVSGEIASWWEPAFLTCIGNHDTAEHDGAGWYHWAVTDMAEGARLFIEPFEAAWGITRSPGCTYYMKDYPESGVRMLVIDAMLYTVHGPEAAAQTAWIADRCADARRRGLCVLIATHILHGGAVPVPCAFSRTDAARVRVSRVCNTPDDVTDAVAREIARGLRFLGYICGHTHQDGIWDALGDGTQMMYCVTCANGDRTGVWGEGDIDRTNEPFACNLMTFDPHSLCTRIERFGADTDKNGRRRTTLTLRCDGGRWHIVHQADEKA